MVNATIVTIMVTGGGTPAVRLASAKWPIPTAKTASTMDPPLLTPPPLHLVGRQASSAPQTPRDGQSINNTWPRHAPEGSGSTKGERVELADTGECIQSRPDP